MSDDVQECIASPLTESLAFSTTHMRPDDLEQC